MAMTTLTFVVVIVAIFILNLTQYAQGGERAPSLETFATYEDMQRYFANRNLRSLRFIENPTDDSYINAYNQHNEQPFAQAERHKRSAIQKKLPNEPTTLLKFEISDAVEPSDEVKLLINQHRSRDLKLSGDTKKSPDIGNTTPSTTTNRKQESPKNPIKKNLRAGKMAKRTKRATNRQPANFLVKMIPFEVTDAREPDAQTKNLIKRMRALELEKLQVHTFSAPTGQSLPTNVLNVPNTQVPTTKYGKLKHTYKRTRRSALHTPPQMIKFELEDAKEPDHVIKNLMQQKQTRESKDIKELTSVIPPTKANQTAADRADMNMSADQSSHESKRYYVYKESPVKSKKSVNSLPHEVQHVISHLMKDNNGGKAYVKYIPAQQVDYGRLKSYYSTKSTTPVFGAKIQPVASYVKYVQQLQKQPEQVVQIHTVPVVEKIRYVYTPVASTSVGGHGQAAQAHGHAYVPHNYVPESAPASSAAISHPIVVHEAAVVEHAAHQHQQQHQQQHQLQQAAEVHHTYSADLSHVHHDEVESSAAQAIKDVPAPHFRASKLDPLLGVDENKLAEGGGISEQYKYELYTSHDQSAAQHEYVPNYAKEEESAAPVIKIEYHAPPDAAKQNYKELHEFKELSALMGKSPEDQIHGLTYLLAKEMQSKLQLQRQHNQHDGGGGEALQHQQRPQDNTAPILFHPAEDAHHQLLQQQPAEVAVEHVSPPLGLPKKFIGMAKTKQYIPIVEGGSSSVEQKSSEEQLTKSIAFPVQHYGSKLEPQAPHPSSFIEYGLSPNYKGLENQPQHKKVLVEQRIQHPIGAHQHGLIGVGAHHGLQAAAASEHSGSSGGEHGGDILKLSAAHDSHDLQYASKYAFGYRIRDFHTGNDFGHKQNRDLNGVTRGQYHILLPDGRIQNVIYHADDTGFHADVSFETGH